MKASLNGRGAEITVEFEEDIYKFDAAAGMIKDKTLSLEQETILLQAMSKAVAKARSI